MSWRTIVVSSSAKLDYQLGFLVVRTDTTTKVHLNEISVLMLESTAISLTASLVNELLKRKIKIVFCDEKRNPCGEVIPYYGSHDTSIKIRKQILWDNAIKAVIWTEVVSDKIRKQSEFLAELRKQTEADLLKSYLSEMTLGDTTNREGHAAKVYFNAVFGIQFTRAEENPINAALNYGYAIILSAFNREVVNNGYITQLGIFHDNMFNPFNLSSDIMEPFRILVDRKVYSMQPEKLEHEEKAELVNLLNEEVYIADRKEYVNNAIKIYVKSVLDALSENDSSMIRFYKNEL
ncbi:MAG: type II CRISPR-associated endonuclease Cas1 [Lachnospiraceae bacterium]|nr:type II CRISPR-associated endonuclease Cas1 [Lachnospiraceae bacterium]